MGGFFSSNNEKNTKTANQPDSAENASLASPNKDKNLPVKNLDDRKSQKVNTENKKKEPSVSKEVVNKNNDQPQAQEKIHKSAIEPEFDSKTPQIPMKEEIGKQIGNLPKEESSPQKILDPSLVKLVLKPQDWSESSPQNQTDDCWKEVNEWTKNVRSLQIEDFENRNDFNKFSALNIDISKLHYVKLYSQDGKRKYEGIAFESENSGCWVFHGIGKIYFAPKNSDNDQPQNGASDWTWNTTLYVEGLFGDGELLTDFVRLIDSKGMLYEGAHSEEMPKGPGIMTDPNGATTQCDNWSNGQENGKTIKTDMNGRRIAEGLMKGGRLEGEGFLLDTQPRGHPEYFLVGEFYNGKLEGQGKKTYKNGCSFIGNFLHSEESGYGRFIFKNGGAWEGYFSGGKAQGKGRLTDRDGKPVVANCSTVGDELERAEEILSKEELQRQQVIPQVLTQDNRLQRNDSAHQPQIESQEAKPNDQDGKQHVRKEPSLPANANPEVISERQVLVDEGLANEEEDALKS